MNLRYYPNDSRHSCKDNVTRPMPGITKSAAKRFHAEYGADSFQASLADFLAEWFDDNTTVLVHTSGSTGTPKPLRVEKQRMMQSAMLTVRF